MAGIPFVDILGIRVHRLDPGSAMVTLESYLAGGGIHHAVTVNPEYIIQALESPEFKAVLNRADLALADGVGLVWAARILGRGGLSRLAGVDLVESLAALGSERGHRFFFLGAAPGVAEHAAIVLKRRYPGLQVVGVYGGSPDPSEDGAVVDLIRKARPDILLVAYGAPQQDLWIDRNLLALGVPLAIGVGGSFDYLSGRVPRAPRWMRGIGLEWMYRLYKQPWRWRRMARLPRFALLILRQRWGIRRHLRRVGPRSKLPGCEAES